MPTRVRLNCPTCGIVEIFNYEWPDDQAKSQTCPFCERDADFMSAEIVPRTGNPSVIELKEDNDGEISRSKRGKGSSKRKDD